MAIFINKMLKKETKITKASQEANAIKSVAQVLYNNNWSPTKISEHLNIGFKTLQDWIATGRWERLRGENQSTNSGMIADLRVVAAKQMTAMRKNLEQRQDGDEMAMLDSKEIDGVSKLMTMVKSVSPSYGDYATMLLQFNAYLSRINDISEDMKRVVGDYCDDFLNEKQHEIR